MEDLHLAHELAALATRAVHNASLYRAAVDENERNQVLQRMRLQYLHKHIHDMRAPLTAINLLSDLVSRKCQDPQQVLKIAKRIQENVQRITRMLDDIPTVVKCERIRGPELT
jgi:signal transduction histidine kinase